MTWAAGWGHGRRQLHPKESEVVSTLGEKKHLFRSRIVPLFRRFLVDEDAAVQRCGDFFISVVDETGSDRTFEFRLNAKGNQYPISGHLLGDGKIEINAGCAGKRFYEVEELDQAEVSRIVSDWIKSIQAS